MILKTFPSYTLEQLKALDDWSELLSIANVWGFYQSCEEAKREKWQKATAYVREIMDYSDTLEQQKERAAAR